MSIACVLRGGIVASLVAWLLAAPAVRAAEPTLAPPTVADFFRPAKMLKPMLSPSGRYLAAAVSGDDGRIRLAVLDLESLQDSKIVANYSDADVQRFWWLNDRRLAYTITDLQAGSGEWTPPGLWAVDRDGTASRKLIKAHFQFISDKSSLIADRSLPWHWRFHSSLNDGSDDVLVHGGPYVRGAHWAWEPQAQFLASRGYVVIEPEFRGSTGYGFAHFRAGWKQWGLAMQDDLADAVEWAVKQGWVDGQRVCIAGASYGGYATLMGLIKHHDLYQCGFEWVGVSDIELMYTINWSDSSDEWKRFGMPVLVGDRLRDAEQLRATSPLQQAQRLRRPLLIAHGGSDRRVPIQHGSDFYDAVKKTNPQVEWTGYPDEGHGWRKLETHIDFWTRVERFLDKHIGPGRRD